MLDGHCLEYENLSVLNRRVEVLYSYWQNPTKELFTYQGVHSHDYPEAHYALDGPSAFNVSGEEVTISPGQALLIAPGMLHFPTSDNTCGKSFVYNICPPIGELRPLVPEERCRIVDGVSPLLIRQIHEESVRKRAGYQEKLKALFQLCILELLQNLDDHFMTPREPLTRQQYGMIVERYITTHISNGGLSVGDSSKAGLARELNMSTRQLERIVLEVFSMTYSELYAKHKFELAMRLMTEMSWKVKQVSAFMGYSDESNFTRAFTKFYGFSPSKLSYFDIERT